MVTTNHRNVQVRFCVEKVHTETYLSYENSYHMLIITDMAAVGTFELTCTILTKSKCLLVEVMHSYDLQNCIILIVKAFETSSSRVFFPELVLCNGDKATA
jgi:hypothetical protein